jgi:hypothetical protein
VEIRLLFFFDFKFVYMLICMIFACIHIKGIGSELLERGGMV